MIDAIISFSLRQRVFVLLATAGLMAAGLWSAARLPIDAVPDITNIQVQINTEIKGLAPEEIEKLVTYPLEMEMFGVPGMMELRSLSKFGLSQITLVFTEGTDIYRARQLVSERLQNAVDDLPRGVSPKLAPITTGLGEIYYYVVDYVPGYESPDKPKNRAEQLMELKLIHDFVVKPQLRSVSGIAEVNASGGYEKQIVILPKPEKLLASGVTFKELSDTIGENVENAGGSVIQLGGEQIAIRTNGRVESAEEIGNLPVKFRAGAEPLRVEDLADVEVGKNIRTGSATHNGAEAVLGAALMLSGENSRIIAKRVDERIQEIRKKLPPGARNPDGLRSHDARRSDHCDCRKESLRGSGSRCGGASVSAGQLARRAHRVIGHSTFVPFCHHWHGGNEIIRQPDEPRRSGLRSYR